MTFPDAPFETISEFADAYGRAVADALASVDRDKLAEAADLLGDAYRTRRSVFSCGNGGSAAISNHLHCDHVKGVQTDTDLRPRVISLVSTMETLTAIANDICYEDVFLYQLRTAADPGDVLITVSSSGDSENVVRAAEWAKRNDLSVVAMTGFEGGRTARLADINLHVAGDNYGVVEDAHQSIMHMLAQYLRLRSMDPGMIAERRF